MADLIKPRTLKGFRDLLPQAAWERERLLDRVRSVYRNAGYAPIDTPALELTEILLGKGGQETDKQLYRFNDNGGRDVALRFDLTVPFARFAAQHIHELGTPFKRYHIGTVWRGERPQKGRYREFMQCDFDTIGTSSPAADVETLLTINDLLEALEVHNFTIRLNDRRVLNGVLETVGLQERTTDVLRVLDKLPKAGPDAVAEELKEVVDASNEQIEVLLALGATDGDNFAILDRLDTSIGQTADGRAGIDALRFILESIKPLELPAGRVALDLTIARGLDYYTATIYETFLNDIPEIGSVCSGGRYDNLAGLFTKQPLPGVGACLGIDRLLAAFDELGRSGEASLVDVLILNLDDAYLSEYLSLARELRKAGVAADLVPQSGKIGKQLKLADSRGIPRAIIAGSLDFEAGHWQLKDLKSGEQQELSRAQLVEEVTASAGRN